jgi:transposase-like protein
MAFSKEVLDEILKNCHGPDDFYGPSGIMKQLAKALAERAMEAELAGRLGYEKHEQGEKTIGNRRNGKTGKDLRTGQGPVRTGAPRGREGSFEPQIAPKHQRGFRGFGGKILPVHALGLTARQIQYRLKGICAVEAPPELISRVTGEVKEPAAEWRGRALEPVYPVVFLDALRVNIWGGFYGGKKTGICGVSDTFRRPKGAFRAAGLSKTKGPSSGWGS